MFAMINEAAHCVQENISSRADIDLAMLAGLGFPQDKGGILHYADGIGVDVIIDSLKKFAAEFGERFHPAYILKQMVAINQLGKKTKRGFFDYP